LLATLVEVSDLLEADLDLVFAAESLLLSESLSLERLRAARRSAAVFFFEDLAGSLAWSEDFAVSSGVTLGVGAGVAASAASRAAAASLTGAEAGAGAEASGGAGAATGATGAAGVARATCIACSLRAMYMYIPPPKSAARATATTILGKGDAVEVEFMIKHSFVTGDTHVVHPALRDTCQRIGAMRFAKPYICCFPGSYLTDLINVFPLVPVDAYTVCIGASPTGA
jgi:hypothetical protein